MLLHGEAVAIDMALSAELAYGRGLLSPVQRLRVLQVMRDLQLPLWHDSCNLDLLMKVGVEPGSFRKAAWLWCCKESGLLATLHMCETAKWLLQGDVLLLLQPAQQAFLQC